MGARSGKMDERNAGAKTTGVKHLLRIASFAKFRQVEATVVESRLRMRSHVGVGMKTENHHPQG